MIHAMWRMHLRLKSTTEIRWQRGRLAGRRARVSCVEQHHGMAFAYFALVTAMTAQTSDTDANNTGDRSGGQYRRGRRAAVAMR
jgi:uncharacterized membrane protein